MIREFSGGDVVYLLLAARWTIALALTAAIGGGILGLIVAFARIVPLRPLNWLAIAYINLIQGTPLLGQLFVLFFGLPLFGLPVDAWTAAALGLSLYSSAFLGEISGSYLFSAIWLYHHPSGRPDINCANGRIPRSAGQEYIHYGAYRLCRIDPRKPDHDVRNFRATKSLSHSRGDLFRRLFQSVSTQPHLGEENTCRSLDWIMSSSVSAPLRC